MLGPDKVGFDRGAQELAQIGLLQTFVLPGGDGELGQFELDAVHREGTVVLACWPGRRSNSRSPYRARKLARIVLLSASGLLVLAS